MVVGGIKREDRLPYVLKSSEQSFPTTFDELHQYQAGVVLATFSTFFSTLEVCFYVATVAAMGPAENNCFVGFHNYLSVTSSHQFRIMHTHTVLLF